MISRPELAEVIGEQTLHIKDAEKLKQSIAGYLLEEERTDDIESLMRDVLKYRANHGHIEATVISAYELTAALRSEVESVLKTQYPGAKSYVLNQRIDEYVVGGLRIEMAGEELDLTVRTKLNTLKRLTTRKD